MVLTGLTAGALVAVMGLAGASTPVNLVHNPGFDSGTSGWAAGSGATLAAVATGRSGNAAAITSPVQQTVALKDSPSTISSTVKGATYAGAAWVKATKPGVTVQLRLLEWGSSNTSSTSHVWLVDTAWHQLQSSLTAKKSGDHVDLNVIGFQLPAGTALLVDDVSLFSDVAAAVTTPTPTPPPPPTATPTPTPTPAPTTPTVTGGTCSVSAKLVPSCGTWWGVYSSRWATLESDIGRHFDVIMEYKDFSDASGPGIFPNAADVSMGSSRILFFAWQSQVFSGHTQIPWAQIANGSYDTVVRDAAARIKAYGKPVLLGFEPEQDRMMTKGTAPQYIAAFRHLHDVFAAVGATNAVWVWTSTGYLGAGNDALIASLYPGSAYVDWVGYDPYNFYGCPNTSWKNFQQTVAPFYTFAQSKGWGSKPFIIPETGTTYNAGDPAASTSWYTTIPTVLKSYPNIKGVLRWDSAAKCSMKVDNGPGMLAAYSTAGHDTMFSHATHAPTG